MKNELSFNIDHFLNMDIGFWQHLESFCMAECCGIDAYDFSEEKIKETIALYDVKEIVLSLEKMINEIESNELKYIDSKLMNHHTGKEGFLEQMENIKKIIA